MEKDKSTPEVLHQYNLSRKAIGGIFFDEKKKEKRSVSTIHQVIIYIFLITKNKLKKSTL